MIATLAITASADKELRMHGPFEYEEFEVDAYVSTIEFLDTADTRTRMGSNWMYFWNKCASLGDLPKYLWKLEENDFSLNVLDGIAHEEYGSLVL